MSGPHLSPEAAEFLATAPVRWELDPAKPCVWFAAFLAPTPDVHERARRFADRLGIVSWTPMLTKLQKRPDRRPGIVKRGRGATYRKDLVHSPLWPRYRFFALPADKTPFGLLTSREAVLHGIRGLVGNSHGPLVIPAADIEKLRLREAAGEFDQTVRRGRRHARKLPERFAVGRQVNINAGPFRDFLATITGHAGDGKVEVDVKLFGRSNSVELPIDHIS